MKRAEAGEGIVDAVQQAKRKWGFIHNLPILQVSKCKHSVLPGNKMATSLRVQKTA